MPTPPKPSKVISMEGKSHRTKKELAQRKQAEEALLTGTKMKERKETKENKVAHKEYLRINKLLKSIEKNDALYESIINRYCLLQGECQEMEEQREECQKIILELRKGFNDAVKDLSGTERAMLLIDFTRSIERMMTAIMKIDGALQKKRKMLLDIEKENVMTVASALRSIPKKVDKQENPLLKALRDG